MRLRGDYWEQRALEYMQNSGLKLHTRNFHARVGEIDLVMWDRDTLVFIEVRYRKSAHHHSALESVTSTKRRRIVQAARYFLMKKKIPADTNCRFDVLSIEGDKTNPRMQWIEHAFAANGH